MNKLPILNTIECPECKTIQEAEVQDTWPFYTYVHTCIHCKYVIMESEWNVVPAYTPLTFKLGMPMLIHDAAKVKMFPLNNKQINSNDSNNKNDDTLCSKVIKAVQRLYSKGYKRLRTRFATKNL